MLYTADKKPLELTALTSLASDDTIIVGDTSDLNADLITDLGSSFAPIDFYNRWCF